MTSEHEARQWLAALLLGVFFLPLSAVTHVYAVLLGDAFSTQSPGTGTQVVEDSAWGDTSVDIEIVQETSGEDPDATRIDDVPVTPGGIPTPPTPAVSASVPEQEPEAEAAPPPPERTVLALEVPDEPEAEVAEPPPDDPTSDAASDTERDGEAEAVAEAEPPEEREADSAESSPLDALTANAPGADPSRAILGSAGLLGQGEGREYLLPNGGVCRDRFQGVWRAQRYDRTQGKWIRFSLRVSRDGDRLRGVITSRSWGGPASRRRPPEFCDAFSHDYTYRMNATGYVDGDRMEVRGGRATLARVDCPGGGFGPYYPDRFTGTVDVLGQTFLARNNDGEVEFDQSYTFRRVSCDP